jgi:hypothetical protein
LNQAEVATSGSLEAMGRAMRYHHGNNEYCSFRTAWKEWLLDRATTVRKIWGTQQMEFGGGEVVGHVSQVRCADIELK